MESKPKIRRVRKVRKAIPAPLKSDQLPKPTELEALIRFNSNLVEALFNSEPWKEIAFPLLQELIAGVSGRFTNGRFHHGSLTKDWTGNNPLFVAGYQKALMDFHNGLHDFIAQKDKLKELKKNDEKEKSAPVYNPFLEDTEFED